MTMSPAETERKIQQIDNDVQAIYTMLAAIDGTLRRHHNRLEELAAGIDRIDARFAGIDARFDGIDTKFAAIDTRFAAIDARFDGIDTKFAGIDAKLDQVVDLLGGSPRR